jgi:hypothetical protein
MTDHTPGPWNVIDYLYVGVVDDEDNPNGGYVKTYICDCNFMHSIPDGKEMRANARLIAAAPDMLDLLKSIRNYYNLQPHTVLEGSTGMKILQLIANVEG